MKTGIYCAFDENNLEDLTINCFKMIIKYYKFSIKLLSFVNECYIPIQSGYIRNIFNSRINFNK